MQHCCTLGFSFSFVAAFHCRYHRAVLSILHPLSDDARLLTSSTGHRITHLCGPEQCSTFQCRGAQVPLAMFPGRLMFFSVAPNLSGSSEWDVPYVTLLAPRTDMAPRFCAPLFQLNFFPEVYAIAMMYVCPSDNHILT